MMAITLGFAVVIYFGFSSGAEPLTAALLLSAAALVVGVFLGFLFGIPRSLQTENSSGTHPKEGAGTGAESNQETPKPQYKANTNLEQISDWLTKILVGVGLTQFNNIPDLFDRVGGYFRIGPRNLSRRSKDRNCNHLVLFGMWLSFRLSLDPSIFGPGVGDC
jgi:hypothetical protein